MATLTNNYNNDDWPPDTLGGGVITLRQTFRMTYTSDMGYTVTLRGNGLTYDDDGMPAGGTVTGFTVVMNGVTVANLTGTSADFGRAGMMLFGFDRDNGGHEGPNPYGFLQHVLRGNDVVTGGINHDDVRGGAGNDTISTGGESDYVGDEAGADVMDGGEDWDTLSYDEANWRWDSVQGVNLDAAAGMAIDCWGYTDTFTNFERFKDTLYSDTLKGSDIEEESFSLSRGADVVDGRGGFDWVSYDQVDRWGAHRGVNVNLATGVAIDSWKMTDTIANIEGVFGTRFNDTITGNGQDNWIHAGAGVDVLAGAAGYDRLVFWDVGNNDDGGHGIIINLNNAKVVTDDGYGNSETATGFEAFQGSRFGDRMTGNAAANELRGDDGNDTLIGGGGEDELQGDWGNDVINGGTGNNDHIDGGGDNDTLTGSGGNDNFNFGWDLADAGVDTITDFDVPLDTIHIGSWWGGGFTADVLTAAQFRSAAGATTATTADHRVIYNRTTGDLYFDEDGAGGTAAVRFAILSNKAVLTFDDIHIMF